ncbi:unnamed protein product [Caenorhabditis brenneri]
MAMATGKKRLIQKLMLFLWKRDLCNDKDTLLLDSHSERSRSLFLAYHAWIVGNIPTSGDCTVRTPTIKRQMFGVIHDG